MTVTPNTHAQKSTVFAQSDATATIYFIMQFCVKWRLLKSVFSVKIFRNCKGFEKSQFYKNCGAAWSATVCYKAVPTRHFQSVSSFLPMISHDDRPLCLKECRTSLDSMCSCTYCVYSFHIAIWAQDLLICACATRILTVASIRERRLIHSACPEVRRQFESGVWSSNYNSLVATSFYNSASCKKCIIAR